MRSEGRRSGVMVYVNEDLKAKTKSGSGRGILSVGGEGIRVDVWMCTKN